MKNPVIGAVIATSLLITGIFAAPVRAEKLDLNDVGAAIAFFMIGKALVENSGGKGKVTEKPVTNPFMSNTKVPGWSGYHRPMQVLPDICRFSIAARKGRTQDVYGPRCLAEFMPGSVRLPRYCEETVKLPYGKRSRIYEADCLYQAGFTPERPPHKKRK